MNKAIHLSITLAATHALVASALGAGAPSPTDSVIADAPNYAVVWHLKNADQDAFIANVSDQFTQLTDLMESGTIDCLYFGATDEGSEFDRRSNVTFFINSPTAEQASAILDEMVFVREDIATYSLIPVGVKWLGRQPDQAAARGQQKSYMTIWTSLVDEMPEDVLQDQVSAILALWEDGVIENAYFDIEGVSQGNAVTDFVLFVNAGSEKEAREVIHSLPLYQEELAGYTLYPVGVFWMGNDPQE